MNDQIAWEAEELSRKILKTYFCESDVEFMISTFASDIVWLGSGEKMKAEGADKVSAIFREGAKDLIPCDMYEESYIARALDDTLFLCVGDSWIKPKSGTQMFFNLHQRITFIFRLEDSRLKTVHIHNSIPYGDVRDDELFPVEAAQKAYQKLKDELAQRDRQIELMLSQLPGGMMICRMDHDFSAKWISGSLCRLLGYENESEFSQHTGNACRGFVLEEDYDETVGEISGQIQASNTYYCEYRVRKKDGSIIWAADFGKRVEDLEKEEVIYCFISDITRQKEKELEIAGVNREMQRNARFLTQLYNSVPCGIFQFKADETYEIISVNRMTWEFYGYASEEEYCAAIRNPFDMVLEKDRNRIEKMVKALIKEGGFRTYVRESRRGNGSPAWLSVMLERLINANGIDVIQVVFTDITEIKTLQLEREQESLIENRSLRAAICTAYPLILSVNLTKNTYNCFIDEEKKYLLKKQGSYDDHIMAILDQMYPSYQNDFAGAFQREQVLKHFNQGDKELYMEFKEMGGDGVYHWLSLHLIYVENPVNDEILAIELMKVLDGQHAEKARQEQLLRDALSSARAANSAKSDFLSRMSHDIRTPVNAIVGMSTIGQLKVGDPARTFDCFRKIDVSSRYLLSLINDILDMSKIENGKMEITSERFDFTELISEITSIFYPQAKERGIRFHVLHQEPLERFYNGDALRLKQIMMNLLSNALKFTPAAGKITIEIKEEKRTNGHAYLKIAISDTGIGMSKDFMDRIFQPFEQESQEFARNNIGSGLGLSIVYNLVQLMGGTIDVTSEKAKGSRFELMLPFGLEIDDEEEERIRKSRELLNNLEVLVADDDELVGEQTAAILGAIGAHSVYVNSGYKAVEEVKASLACGRVYDIAMIDWRMPDMDGLETTRQIRKLAGPDTMIIIISAYDWSDIEEEAKAAGVSYFISKPLFRSTVCDTFIHLTNAQHKKLDAGRKDISFTGQRVLIVEDNELNLEIAKSLLEMHGITVETAQNGKEAVETFYSSPMDHFLAILMDIRMPVMDGLTATRAIRALDRGDARTTPILAMTANAFDEDKVLAYAAGMTGYFVKPLDVHVLLQELARLASNIERKTGDNQC